MSMPLKLFTNRPLRNATKRRWQVATAASASGVGRLLLLGRIALGRGGCRAQPFGDVAQRGAVRRLPLALELLAIGTDPLGAAERTGQRGHDLLDLVRLATHLGRQLPNL